MRAGGESKISVCYPRGLGEFDCLLMIKILEVDAALGDSYGIQGHLHSFRRVKCLQGCSKKLSMGI